VEHGLYRIDLRGEERIKRKKTAKSGNPPCPTFRTEKLGRMKTREDILPPQRATRQISGQVGYTVFYHYSSDGLMGEGILAKQGEFWRGGPIKRGKEHLN